MSGKALSTICSFIIFSPLAMHANSQIAEFPKQMISEPQFRYANLKVYGDFLYWKASVSDLPYAVFGIIDNSTPLGPIANHESVEQVHFHFDPGFRIGIAGQFNAGWDLDLEWTCFHTDAHASKKAQDDHFIALFWDFFDLVLPDTVTSVKAKQSLKFDQITLNFVKHISLGSHFAIHPFFGGVGAFINQQLNIKAQQAFDPPSVGTEKVHLKNFFTGGGLDIGVQTEYKPLKWLSLYGMGSYSLLYGKFKLSEHEKEVVLNVTPEPIVFVHKQNSREYAVVSSFDVLVGLQLSWYFGRCQLSGYIDYELVFWPGQVRIPRMSTEFISKTTQVLLFESQGDVGFQGITTGLSFSF